MSNITNSTNVAVVAVGATFGSLIVACCWIALCCGGGYKAKKAYDRRSKRFKYKEVPVNAVPLPERRAIPVVPGRIVYPQRREMSVPVVPGRIVSQTDEYTPDLDERIRDFFKEYEIIFFPCRKIDLDRLKIIARKLRFDRVFFATIRGAGRGLYVIVGNRTYWIDLMFTENLETERNLLVTASSIPTTQKLYPIYEVAYVLQVYNLWLNVRKG